MGKLQVLKNKELFKKQKAAILILTFQLVWWQGQVSNAIAQWQQLVVETMGMCGRALWTHL